MGKSSLAPGFRFKPTDVELLLYYLKRKLMGRRLHVNVIAEIDIYKYDPRDLPEKSCWESGDLQWYFFCPREKKYQKGSRMKRATEGGFWKVTGKDRPVLQTGEVVGWIKTLIFHRGRAPQGARTDWVMHEYRLEDKGLADKGVPLDAYVLCMIFQKEGLGPRIGAQYGVPFKEEDWSDNDTEMRADTVQDANIPQPDLGLICIPNQIATNTHSREEVGIGPSGSCISDLPSPSCKVPQPVSTNNVSGQNHVSNSDDILSMLDCFTEENTFFMIDNGKSNTELCSQAASNASMPEPGVMNSYNGPYFPDCRGINHYESCTFDAVSSPCNFLPLEGGNYLTEKPPASNGSDMLSMFERFIEENSVYMDQREKNVVHACLEAVPNATIPDPDLVLPNNCSGSIPVSTLSSDVVGSGPPFETCKYDALPPACGALREVSYGYGTMEKPRPSNADVPVMNCFSQGNPFPRIDDDENEYRDHSNHGGNADAAPHATKRSIYEDLGDLGCLSTEDGYDFSSFLELGDLD